MKTYKVTNKLECNVRFKDTIFESRETKILNVKPNSDKFIVEEVKEYDEKIIVEEIKTEKKPTKLKENKK